MKKEILAKIEVFKKGLKKRFNRNQEITSQYLLRQSQTLEDNKIDLIADKEKLQYKEKIFDIQLTALCHNLSKDQGRIVTIITKKTKVNNT